ncbi:MAG: HPr family phosphocarrier protein [Lachnospiraceae bacterium]|nr:HPr family phosphocarrier protein [Lachnospiraceae bacterium]
MIQKTIRIKKEFGPDIIPYLVQSACHYNCSLHIQEGEKKINMKSIMGMTILKLQQGTSLELIADGSDEQLAAGEIAGCFECD